MQDCTKYFVRLHQLVKDTTDLAIKVEMNQVVDPWVLQLRSTELGHTGQWYSAGHLGPLSYNSGHFPHQYPDTKAIKVHL